LFGPRGQAGAKEDHSRGKSTASMASPPKRKAVSPICPRGASGPSLRDLLVDSLSPIELEGQPNSIASPSRIIGRQGFYTPVALPLTQRDNVTEVGGEQYRAQRTEAHFTGQIL